MLASCSLFEIVCIHSDLMLRIAKRQIHVQWLIIFLGRCIIQLLLLMQFNVNDYKQRCCLLLLHQSISPKSSLQLGNNLSISPKFSLQLGTRVGLLPLCLSLFLDIFCVVCYCQSPTVALNIIWYLSSTVHLYIVHCCFLCSSRYSQVF